MRSPMAKVFFATGSRADYGIVRRYLKLLDQDDGIDLSILVTGALLDEQYGGQVRLIEEDGFSIGARIPIPIDPTSGASACHSMAVALDSFADFFKYNVPDLLILLGDRYEILSVAIAAAMQRIPILHIHGGEATFANYDEFIRHSITKMSSYHFTATEEYRVRVIQLGEQPENVFNLGALGAENCLCIDESEVSEEVRGLPAKDYLVILFHPETISGVSPRAQMAEILKALDVLGDPLVVFLGTNADTGSDDVRLLVAQYVTEHSNARYFENLRTGSYHWLVKNSICLVGNSSSGLIEAPSLSAYTVNIGNRQAGRTRGDSVIDVPCDMAEIIKAIQSVRDKPPVSPYSNPYYKQGAANEYFIRTKWVLRRLRDEESVVKTFYDIPLVPEGEASINE